MRLNRKIAIAAGAATLTIGGVAAAAVTAPPEAADKGLMTAEEHTGTELPASKDDHPTQADHPGGGNEVAPEALRKAQVPVDNHGADLSAVAQGDTTGRDHGAACLGGRQRRPCRWPRRWPGSGSRRHAERRWDRHRQRSQRRRQCHRRGARCRSGGRRLSKCWRARAPLADRRKPQAVSAVCEKAPWGGGPFRVRASTADTCRSPSRTVPLCPLRDRVPRR